MGQDLVGGLRQLAERRDRAHKEGHRSPIGRVEPSARSIAVDRGTRWGSEWESRTTDTDEQDADRIQAREIFSGI